MGRHASFDDMSNFYRLNKVTKHRLPRILLLLYHRYVYDTTSTIPILYKYVNMMFIEVFSVLCRGAPEDR